jgi:hypothetical protein
MIILPNFAVRKWDYNNDKQHNNFLYIYPDGLQKPFHTSTSKVFLVSCQFGKILSTEMFLQFRTEVNKLILYSY